MSVDVNQILINVIKFKIINEEIDKNTLSKIELENWISKYFYDCNKTLEYCVDFNLGYELISDLFFISIENIDIDFVVMSVLEDLKES